MTSTNIRENLVNTAVKFLQNPKVKESPFGQKRLFLEKKGLTEEEIDLAIKRSGTSDDDANNSSQPVVAMPSPVPLPVIPLSPWSRFKDVTFTIAVIGGASYAIYRFIKNTLLPYLRGEDSTETRLKKIEKHLSQVQTNMTDVLSKMSTTLTSIEAIMSKQQEKLQVVVHEVVDKQNTQSLVKYQDQQNSSEIKAEIASLKSLLVSRHQFAAAPQTTPIIPSWQREAKKESSDTPQKSVESTPQRSRSEDTTGSSGNESSGSIEEKSSWVKIDDTDRIGSEESSEDLKVRTADTEASDIVIPPTSPEHDIQEESEIVEDSDILGDSENVTVDGQ